MKKSIDSLRMARLRLARLSELRAQLREDVGAGGDARKLLVQLAALSNEYMEALVECRDALERAEAKVGELYERRGGAGSGNRTHMVSPPRDFESRASTNSAIPASGK